MKKTKIIVTVGPSLYKYTDIKNAIKKGVNIFRLNFSHGDYKFFKKTILNIKKAREKLQKPVAIMQDLQGPKIRVSKLEKNMFLKKGEIITISNKCIDEKTIPVNFNELYTHAKVNDKILINDGLIKLKVIKVNKDKKQIKAKVINGGEVSSHKGVNLPDTKLNIPSLTEKDKNDLIFGLKNKVDIISLSFVKKKEDVLELKKFIKKHTKSLPLIIAKIEKPEAVKNFDNILRESDGVMVARGDLAVETGYKKIPVLQKKFIDKSNRIGKIVIVATQMLESMINNAYPERAEITDVYNAVIEGADCLMLSGETSIGRYPLKAIKVMSDIILMAEREKIYEKNTIIKKNTEPIKNYLSFIASISSKFLQNTLIGVNVKTISDVIYISDYKTPSIIIAFTKDKNLYYKLSIFGGIYPYYYKKEDDIYSVIKSFKKTKYFIYINSNISEKIKKGKLEVIQIK